MKRKKVVSERQSKVGSVLEGVLQCVAVCCNVRKKNKKGKKKCWKDSRKLIVCSRVCCSVLLCVAVCCSVLQRVAVC